MSIRGFQIGNEQMQKYDYNALDNLPKIDTMRTSLYTFLNIINWDKVTFTDSNAEQILSNVFNEWSSPINNVLSISVEHIGEEEFYPIGTDTSTIPITVTALFSDGSSHIINSGYSLTPSKLSEGINTITVSYGNKTNTFTVTSQGRIPFIYHFNNNIDPVHSTSNLELITNIPLYDDGKFEKAIKITNTQTSTLYTSTMGGLTSFDEDFTIAFWAKGTSEVNNQFFCNAYWTGSLGIGTTPNPQRTDIELYEDWEFDSYAVNVSAQRFKGLALIWYNSKIYFRGSDPEETKSFNMHIQNANFNVTNWHHYAICRKNNILRVFIDGNVIIKMPVDYNLYIAPYTGFGYGSNESAAQLTPNYSTGVGATGGIVYYDELIIIDGYGLYDQNFTPPNEPYNY